MIHLETNKEIHETIMELADSCIKYNNYRGFISKFDKKRITSTLERHILNNFKEMGISQKSLQLDIDELEQNPYYKNIELKEYSKGGISLQSIRVPKGTLIDVDFPHMLGDLMLYFSKCGYFNKDIDIVALKQGENVWMSPSLSELNTLREGGHTHITFMEIIY